MSDPTLVCGLHNKRRGRVHLEDNDGGGYRCRAGHECKEAVAPKQTDPLTGESEAVVVCTVHGKRRYQSHMREEPGIAGQPSTFVCLPEAQCKLVSPPSQRVPLQAAALGMPFPGMAVPTAPFPGRGRVPAGYPLGRGLYGQRGLIAAGFPSGRGIMRAASTFYGYGSYPTPQGQYALCAKHGKQRSLQSLQQVNNYYECKPSAECKLENPTKEPEREAVQGSALAGNFLCSIHNRLRTGGNLHRDPATGLFACLPHRECKLPQATDGVGGMEIDGA